MKRLAAIAVLALIEGHLPARRRSKVDLEAVRSERLASAERARICQKRSGSGTPASSACGEPPSRRHAHGDPRRPLGGVPGGARGDPVARRDRDHRAAGSQRRRGRRARRRGVRGLRREPGRVPADAARRAARGGERGPCPTSSCRMRSRGPSRSGRRPWWSSRPSCTSVGSAGTGSPGVADGPADAEPVRGPGRPRSRPLRRPSARGNCEGSHDRSGIPVHDHRTLGG
jgi:hypothetical protein